MADGTGAFKVLKKLRNEKRADIVGLIIGDPNGCGLSTRVGTDAEDAIFVVHHACAVITHSIAHEIGHILDDRVVDPNNSPIPYAHGYINGTKWQTMRGYKEGCGGCQRIPSWSNPRICTRVSQLEPPPATMLGSFSSRLIGSHSLDEGYLLGSGARCGGPYLRLARDLWKWERSDADQRLSEKLRLLAMASSAKLKLADIHYLSRAQRDAMAAQSFAYTWHKFLIHVRECRRLTQKLGNGAA
jgi:hypothetical protein